MKQLTVISLALCFLLHSCTHFEEIVIKTDEKRLAVFAMIHPGDSIHVSVGALLPIGTQVSSIFSPSQTSVIIRNLNNGSEIPLSYLGRDGIFGTSQKNYKIDAGVTYKILVNSIDYPSLTATTTVPSSGQLLSRESLKASTFYNESYGGYMFNLLGSWKSDNNQSGYLLMHRYKDGNRFFTKLIPQTEIININGEFTFNSKDNYFPSGDSYQRPDALNEIILATLNPDLVKFFNAYNVYYNIDDYVLNGYGLAALAGYKGIIPKFNNIEGGYGVFGACILSAPEDINVIYPKK